MRDFLKMVRKMIIVDERAEYNIRVHFQKSTNTFAPLESNPEVLTPSGIDHSIPIYIDDITVNINLISAYVMVENIKDIVGRIKNNINQD